MVRNWDAEFSGRKKGKAERQHHIKAVIYGDTASKALENLKSKYDDTHKVVLKEKDAELYNRVAIARLSRPDRCG